MSLASLLFRRGGRRPRPVPPCLETLEDRTLLSGPAQFIAEPNDTPAQAFDTGIDGSATQPVTFVGQGKLGDNAGAPNQNDRDYIRLDLNGGDRVGIGVFLHSAALNGISLWDESGQQVPTEWAYADDPRIPFPDDPRLENPQLTGRRLYLHWTAKESGTYFVLVDELAASIVGGQFVPVDYDVEVRVVPRVPLGPATVYFPPPAEPNDTISQAIDAGPMDFGGVNLLQFYQSGLLGDNPHLPPYGNAGQDVDMYKVSVPDVLLADGGPVTARIDVNTITPDFLAGVHFPQPMPVVDEMYLDKPQLNLRVFDETGRDVTGELDLFLNGSVTSGTDLSAHFSPPAGGPTTYYLGINLGYDYDPLTEGSGPEVSEEYTHEIPYVISIMWGDGGSDQPPPDDRPDIVASELTWDTTQGGVDFGYTVSGAALTQDTTARLYWASGTTADTILAPATAAITIPQTVPVGQQQTVTLAPGDFLGGPAPGASYLLAVVNPDHQVDESDETNDVIAVAYDPQVTVTARYDGDPRDQFLGRYFAGTDVLSDNFYTVRVSDSLYALRPTIEVMVGGQTLDATASPTAADTFVTGSFDPGSLPPGDVSLHAEALVQGRDAADVFATVRVVPIPGWAQALLGFRVDFDTAAGAYVFDGFLPGLSLGGTAFTLPADVPFIGGQPLQARAGFEVRTVAPLDVSLAPTVEGGLQADLTLGRFSLPIASLPPTVRLDDDNWTFTVTPGAALDAVTLDEPTGFSLTLALDGKVPTPLRQTLFDAFTVAPFAIPVALEFEVAAALDVLLHAHAQVVYDFGGLEFLPGGTYLGLGLEGSLSATARAGWFPPAWVQNLLNARYGRTFRIASLELKDTLALALSLDAEEHFGGPGGTVQPAGHVFRGGLQLSNKLDLLLQVGGATLIDLVLADARKTWTLL